MMKMDVMQKLLGAIVLFVMLSASEANAQASQTVNVSATVPDVCVINGFATPLAVAFGNIDATGAADATAGTTLTWRCSQGTPVSLEMTAGDSGNASARTMRHTNTTDTLAYNLCTDALCATPWGDDVNGAAAVTATGNGMQNPIPVQIFGLVTNAAALAAIPGVYSDSVTVTLVF